MPTDKDTRISAWSRADAAEGGPGRAVDVVFQPEIEVELLPWSDCRLEYRRKCARMAAAAIDAYLKEHPNASNDDRSIEHDDI